MKLPTWEQIVSLKAIILYVVTTLVGLIIYINTTTTSNSDMKGDIKWRDFYANKYDSILQAKQDKYEAAAFELITARATNCCEPK